MLVKSQVKYIQSLGHKKFRDADGVFVAEGPKIVQELLQSQMVTLIQGFATAEWILANQAMVRNRETRFVETSPKELERISFHNTPHQVLAIFSKPVFKSIQEAEGLTLLLDMIQDPGNLGTLIRTADWFGVRRIVCSRDTVDVFNPKVVQSAMGSIIRVEMIYTDLADYLQEYRQIPLYAASLDGEDISGKIQLAGAMLLVGNESRGIHPSLESQAFKKIRIPRRGGAESLNVAVATGIILSQMELIS